MQGSFKLGDKWLPMQASEMLSQLHMGWWFGSDSPQETLRERYSEFFRCAIERAKFY
jgi:hypothetical protein